MNLIPKINELEENMKLVWGEIDWKIDEIQKSMKNEVEEMKKIVQEKTTQIQKQVEENSKPKIFIPNLNEKQVKHLEDWKSLRYNDILFNSNVDNWSKYISVLNQRIIRKKQLILVIEDEDGELFGYYLNTQIKEKYGKQSTDNKSFHFNLQSKNN